jgi:hypothetical protein
MRENEKAHHMSVLKQQAYDTAMERIRDKVCDLITVIRLSFFYSTSFTLFLSPILQEISPTSVLLSYHLPCPFLSSQIHYFYLHSYLDLLFLSATKLPSIKNILSPTHTYDYLLTIVFTNILIHSGISRSLPNKVVSMKDSVNLADDPGTESLLRIQDLMFGQKIRFFISYQSTTHQHFISHLFQVPNPTLSFFLSVLASVPLCLTNKVRTDRTNMNEQYGQRDGYFCIEDITHDI